MTIIITEEGWKFGGYTDALWSSKRDFYDWTYKSSKSSFIFSLNLKRKYSINKYLNAIFCSGNYGPTFGAHDIDIHNTYFNKTSKCNSPSSYNVLKKNEFNGGKSDFMVKELEVYLVQEIN